jgi:hypothetical protein
VPRAGRSRSRRSPRCARRAAAIWSRSCSPTSRPPGT